MYLKSVLACFNVRQNRSLSSNQHTSLSSKDCTGKFSSNQSLAQQSTPDDVREAEDLLCMLLICLTSI